VAKGETSKRTNPMEMVKHVLEKAGMAWALLDDAPGFVIKFKEGDPPVTGIAMVYDEDRRFIFYLEFKERAAPNRQSEVVEFITRANFGMTFGNFEMDYKTGIVRYRTSMDYTGGKLQPVATRNVILGAMEGIEVYAQSLLDVLKGKKSAKQGIKEAEGDLETD
jgi:hypothetical protein